MESRVGKAHLGMAESFGWRKRILKSTKKKRHLLAKVNKCWKGISMLRFLSVYADLGRREAEPRERRKRRARPRAATVVLVVVRRRQLDARPPVLVDGARTHEVVLDATGRCRSRRESRERRQASLSFDASELADGCGVLRRRRGAEGERRRLVRLVGD